MSAHSSRQLALMPATSDTPSDSSTPSPVSLVPDMAVIQNTLAPDERLLAVLHGMDSHGSVCWLITPRRLVGMCCEQPDDRVMQVALASVTCVEQRTDPLGTWLRVRATGRQLHMQTIDASQATHFCSMLRERAGIGQGVSVPMPRPRPMHGGGASAASTPTGRRVMNG